METIFFFVPLIFGILLSCDASLLRKSRQYDYEDYDLVSGSLLGECTFYGDFTTDCTGRLTCRPSDVEDRPSTSELNRICPKETGLKSGRWDRDQVIPSTMISRDAGSGRIGKCQFYAIRGAGSFKCTGVNADTWKGTFTGSLNSAFRLGLSSTGGGSSYDRTGTGSSYDRYGTGSGRGVTGDDDYRPSGAYDRDRVRDRDDYGSGGRYSATTDRYSYGSGYGSATTDRYSYGSGYGSATTDRYSYGSGYGRDRDNDVDTRYQTTYRGSARDRDDYVPRTTTEDVTMCTYMNDGKGTCRDCSERIERKETSSEIRTTKHYTCSGPETRTTWTENNGIMPRGIRPDPYAYTRKVQATCIFRTNPKKYDCHGSSNDGNCATDGYGSSGSTSYGSGTTQRCLGGEKWSGTYSGSVY